MENRYVVYILECADGTLYTGITNDLPRRLHQHQKGTAAKYTRTRRPVSLRYVETGWSREEALRRERKIKGMRREDKLRLISERNEEDEPTKKL